MSTRLYITPNIYRDLCPETCQLQQRLDDCISSHAHSDDIYHALHQYFVHRNGIISNGKVVLEPCAECSRWLVDNNV
jgi:hypothetical protein